MLSRLSVPGVVRCLGIETDGSRPVLVLEDGGGIRLRSTRPKPLVVPPDHRK
jgi:hypothetical protein